MNGDKKHYDAVVISVGVLPEWYNEMVHDYYLEILIGNEYSAIADDVVVEYNYNKSFLLGFDDTGDQITNHPIDIQGIFDKVKVDADAFREDMDKRIDNFYMEEK